MAHAFSQGGDPWLRSPIGRCGIGIDADHPEEIRIAFPSQVNPHSITYVEIKPGDFEALTRAMMKANPEAAIRAFGAVLKDGIPEPVKYESWSAQAQQRNPAKPSGNESAT